MDLLELRLDQVEVVEQPLGRRADVVAGGGLHADVAVRLAQRADVAAQAREEGRPRASRARAARCVSPRLRPCCAKRCRPKISERIGGCTGAARAVEHARTAPAMPPGTRRCSPVARHAAYQASEPRPISSASTTSVVTKRAATKPCSASAPQRSANSRPLSARHSVQVLAERRQLHRRGVGVVAERGRAPARPGGGIHLHVADQRVPETAISTRRQG